MSDFVSHSRSYNRCMSRHVDVFACAILTGIAPTAAAQKVLRAYCGKDGKAHIVHRGGAAQTPAAEPEQIGCEHITVAGDGRTVGWLVLVENCCTSYSIPIAPRWRRSRTIAASVVPIRPL